MRGSVALLEKKIDKIFKIFCDCKSEYELLFNCKDMESKINEYTEADYLGADLGRLFLKMVKTIKDNTSFIKFLV